MENKQMLEMAAKAAGYRAKYFENDERLRSEHIGYRDWNPLDDDKEAFDLAVKLGIKLEFSEHCVWAEKTFSGGMTRERTPFVGYRNNRYAATRFAIVQAAAAIGASI
jgi:hypothetical protein